VALDLTITVLRAPMRYIYHLVGTTLKNPGLNQPRNETTTPHTTYDITVITAPSNLAHVHPTRLDRGAPDEMVPPLINKNTNYINSNRRRMPMGNPSPPPYTHHGYDARGLDSASTKIGGTGKDNNPLLSHISFGIARLRHIINTSVLIVSTSLAMCATALWTIVDHLLFNNDAEATLDMDIEADDGWLVDEQPPRYCPFAHAIEIWAQMYPDYVPTPYVDDEDEDNSILDCEYIRGYVSSYREDQLENSNEEDDDDSSLAYSEASSIDFDNGWLEDQPAASDSSCAAHIASMKARLAYWKDCFQSTSVNMSTPLMDVDTDTMY